MKFVVWDTEANGLSPDKFYCLSYKTHDGQKGTISDYQGIRDFFLSFPDHYFVAHNCRGWDLPNLDRVVGLTYPSRIIDSLFLSYYVRHDRRRHGLEWIGVEYGIPKPKIDSWTDQTQEEYEHRCEQDVEINHKDFVAMLKKLRKIYKNDDNLEDFLRYLDFKARSAALAEESGWLLDKERCENAIERLSSILREKTDELTKALPPVPIKKERTKPRVLFKANGDLSVAGTRWKELTDRAGVSIEYDGIIEEIIGYDPPNPDSVEQRKSWLFSLGWKPRTFKEVRNAEGTIREVPQINLERGEGVCPSVLELVDTCAAVLALEGVGVLSHRISILKGFLRDVDERGYLHARVAGLTNTLRFKHAELVNLPKPDKAYAEDIRACLIAPEGYVLCGSDQSSLEDRTKQHYMMPYDPEYVQEMNTKDFDPHIDIAVLGGLMTPEEGKEFKLAKAEKREPRRELDTIRGIAKNTNYAGVYGAGAPKIAKTAGITLAEAKKLHNTYWERNWSVKAVAKAQYYKEVDGELWLLNPVSGFYYSLRYEKDIFSTLNQSTGVFCFDTWLSRVLKKRNQITAQFHDEGVWCIPEGKEEAMSNILKEALDETNQILGLNRELGIDIKFGKSYDEIH